MKRQIISLAIAMSTVILTAFPGFTNTVKNVALPKINSVKYKAIKLDNSMDAMLNPEEGGINPIPPLPPWIPPVEEGLNDKMPPAHIPKSPGYGNYIPMRSLPPSVPRVNPPIKNEGQFINTPYKRRKYHRRKKEEDNAYTKL